jgi:hypothetical protein
MSAEQLKNAASERPRLRIGPFSEFYHFYLTPLMFAQRDSLTIESIPRIPEEDDAPLLLRRFIQASTPPAAATRSRRCFRPPPRVRQPGSSILSGVAGTREGRVRSECRPCGRAGGRGRAFGSGAALSNTWRVKTTPGFMFHCRWPPPSQALKALGDAPTGSGHAIRRVTLSLLFPRFHLIAIWQLFGLASDGAMPFLIAEVRPAAAPERIPYPRRGPGLPICLHWRCTVHASL